MMRVNYTQKNGFKQIREVPANVTNEQEYSRGIFIGPPDLSGLGLPLEQTKQLNNWLVDQELVEFSALGRPGNYDKLLAGIRAVTGKADKELMVRVLIIYQDYFDGG
jgi:hypothetical protein